MTLYDYYGVAMLPTVQNNSLFSHKKTGYCGDEAPEGGHLITFAPCMNTSWLLYLEYFFAYISAAGSWCLLSDITLCDTADKRCMSAFKLALIYELVSPASLILKKKL